MRPSVFAFTFTVSSVLTLAGCGDDRPIGSGFHDNEIVFGITQKTTSDGKPSTTAGWELLALGSHGWSSLGRVDESRSCFLETLSDRLGDPRVDDGLATFTGGSLAPNGLQIVANQSPDGDVKVDGAGWASGDVLTFQSHGFAAPDVFTRMRAPATTLDLTAPALSSDASSDSSGDANAQPMTIARDTDFHVTWNPPAAPSDPSQGDPGNDNVLVAFEDGDGTKDSPTTELRCFFAARDGQGDVPHDLIAKLPGAPAKGTLRLATHRQRDWFGPGGWHVYVVAGTIAHEVPFATDR